MFIKVVLRQEGILVLGQLWWKVLSHLKGICFIILFIINIFFFTIYNYIFTIAIPSPLCRNWGVFTYPNGETHLKAASVLHNESLFLARAIHQWAKVDTIRGVDTVFGKKCLDRHFDWYSVNGLATIQTGLNNLEKIQHDSLFFISDDSRTKIKNDVW